VVAERIDGLAHADGQERPVGEPRERVVVGEVGEALLVALLLGHVVHGHHGAELPAVLVDQGLPVDADLAQLAVRRGQDDLGVAQPLAGHGAQQRVLVGLHRRAVGVAQHPAARDAADRLHVVTEPVEAAGGGVEDRHPALGVAGHDPLVEGVEQHAEELLLLAEGVSRPLDVGHVGERADDTGHPAVRGDDGLRAHPDPAGRRVTRR